MLLFQRYRHLVPEFENDLLFKGFLITFERHVRKTLERDRQARSLSHWWAGPEGCKTSLFVDALDGECKRLDDAGYSRLGYCFAVEALKVIDAYFTTRCYSSFFEKPLNEIGLSALQNYIDLIPTDPFLETQIPEELKYKPGHLLDKDAHQMQRNQNVSQAKLSKRKPDLSEAEEKKRERERLRKEAYRARKKALPLAEGMLL